MCPQKLPFAQSVRARGALPDHGHPAGDALLARLGSRLIAATAADGGAFRVGGDEFCVLIGKIAIARSILVATLIRSRHERRTPSCAGTRAPSSHPPSPTRS